MESLEILEKRVAEWVASQEGKKSLEDTAAVVRAINEKTERDRVENAKGWHRLMNTPVTI